MTLIHVDTILTDQFHHYLMKHRPVLRHLPTRSISKRLFITSSIIHIYYVIFTCSRIQQVNRLQRESKRHMYHNLYICRLSTLKALKAWVESSVLCVSFMMACIQLTTLTCSGSDPGLNSLLLLQLPGPPDRKRTDDDD